MTFPLLDMADRAPLADASLEAFAHIRQTLTEREIEVFLKVCDYVALTGYQDVTGGELALWADLPVTSVRPRIHGLVHKGWLTSGAIRSSRVRELRCHPVWPAVPREAVERAR